MFGGYQDVTNNYDLGDTWEWDGEQWLQRFPAHLPPARHGAMACFDEGRGTVLMFGGENQQQNILGDTWEWDGVDWQLLASSGPTPRSQGGMAFDYANGRSVLFGGFSYPGVMERNMWEFAGGTWRLLAVQPLPPGAGSFLFCSDPQRGEIVFQGGWQGSRTLDACWVWDGSAWSSANTRGYFDMSGAAYDPLRGRIVAFGGGAGQPPMSAETWEWDAGEWIQRSPGLSPSLRFGPRLAFDTVSSRMLLFGGDFYGAQSDETWEYFHFTPASYTKYGFGCRGTNGLSPQLDAVDGGLPWIGEGWLLRISDIPARPASVAFGLVGHSRATAYGLQLPYDLGVVGMPGCLLQMSGDESTTLIPNLGGHADWLIHFPPDVRLVGTNWFMQAAVLDAGANALDLIVSNGGHASPGMK